MEIKVKYSTMIVKDMVESVNFYKNVLEFEVDSDYKPKEGTWITLMKSGTGAMLELIEDKTFDIGLYSVGMYVENLDLLMEDVKSNKVNVITEITPTLVGKMSMITDPNGIKIALIQHK